MSGTSSYTIGMCEIYFGMGTSDSASLGQITSFGNIVAGEVTPDIAYLEHFKSVEGEKRKDKTVAITKSIAVPFTFDELSASNVAKFLYSLELGGYKSAAMQTTSVPVEGRAILRLKTQVGQSFMYTIPRCALKAEGGLAFNIEAWMSAKFNLDILYSSSYTIPDDTDSAPYGYLDLDVTASTILDTCEAGWVIGPDVTATMVVLSQDATVYAVGAKSTKIVVATYWAHDSAAINNGVNATNCLAYKTITATDITPYSFVELRLRSNTAFAQGNLYLGFDTTATPIGIPVDYTYLDALSEVNAWETQRLPVRNRSAAGMDAITNIAIYGTAAVDTAAAPTIFIDQIRMVK